MKVQGDTPGCERASEQQAPGSDAEHRIPDTDDEVVSLACMSSCTGKAGSGAQSAHSKLYEAKSCVMANHVGVSCGNDDGQDVREAGCSMHGVHTAGAGMRMHLKDSGSAVAQGEGTEHAAFSTPSRQARGVGDRQHMPSCQ